jgi:predicted phosphodiesterase
MIIAIGDVHGEFKEMQSKMVEIMESAGEPVNFVQVGDFGLGFERPKKDHDRLTTINHFLKEKDSNLWVIRGNHDNPGFWQWGCGYEFSNIHFVPDDSVVELDGKSCYFAGGAVSVDRCKRTQGIDYWKGEQYNVDNIQFPIPYPVDILFTHDVYHPVSPFGTTSDTLKYWCEKDEELMGDIVYSQIVFKNLYDSIYKINPNFSWYHGHYHEPHVTNNDGQVVHSLSILEFKEVR